MLTEAYRDTLITIGGNYAPNILSSDGDIFWESLPADQKDLNDGRLAKLEMLLMSCFPEPETGPKAKFSDNHKLIRLALVVDHGQQIGQNCTWIAWANALRILDEPREEHPRQFQSVTVRDMRSFLEKLKAGAVAIMDWPHSPNPTREFTLDPTYPRLVTGFTQNDKGLFFHLVGPRERIYSFRDLMVTCIWGTHVFERGITPDDINEVAERALIIEKRSSHL